MKSAEELYELYLKNNGIDDDILSKAGFTENDINSFIMSGIISPYEEGKGYYLDNYESLRLYLKQVSKEQNYCKNIQILDIMFEMPNAKKSYVLKQKVYNYIKIDRVDKAVETFKTYIE